MLNSRTTFYNNVVDKTILDRKASILVLAAGLTDKIVFDSLGFKDVTFSNVDSNSGSTSEFAPFHFQEQDAENLNYDNDSFDYVVIHAALHHCQSPHRALLEMYRVARKGILCFEGRDSSLMKILEYLGLTEQYECSAVYSQNGKSGGFRNGPVPNFVYRWTEREVQKTIKSFAPHATHQFNFHYGNASPALLDMPGISFRKTAIRIAYSLYKVFVVIAPKQQNLFSFSIFKPNLPNDFQGWITCDNQGLKFNMTWGNKTFG